MLIYSYTFTVGKLHSKEPFATREYPRALVDAFAQMAIEKGPKWTTIPPVKELSHYELEYNDIGGACIFTMSVLETPIVTGLCLTDQRDNKDLLDMAQRYILQTFRQTDQEPGFDIYQVDRYPCLVSVLHNPPPNMMQYIAETGYISSLIACAYFDRLHDDWAGR